MDHPERAAYYAPDPDAQSFPSGRNGFVVTLYQSNARATHGTPGIRIGVLEYPRAIRAEREEIPFDVARLPVKAEPYAISNRRRGDLRAGAVDGDRERHGSAAANDDLPQYVHICTLSRTRSA